MATKVGIIGAGGMVDYHIKGFRNAGAEVVAIADKAIGAAKRVAELEGVPHVYGDVAEMLAVDEIDAVWPRSPFRWRRQ